MKLRILDDSLRLRLSRSEVAALARGERIENATQFPGGARLVYALSTADIATLRATLRATFADGRIDVIVPRARAANWADSEEVSINGSQRTDEGALGLLIEKDFECLLPREGEDPTDRYPNPKKRDV